MPSIISKLILAVIVGLVTGFVFWLVGWVLTYIPVAIVQGIGGIFKAISWIAGLIASLWYFFIGNGNAHPII